MCKHQVEGHVWDAHLLRNLMKGVLENQCWVLAPQVWLLAGRTQCWRYFEIESHILVITLNYLLPCYYKSCGNKLNVYTVLASSKIIVVSLYISISFKIWMQILKWGTRCFQEKFIYQIQSIKSLQREFLCYGFVLWTYYIKYFFYTIIEIYSFLAWTFRPISTELCFDPASFRDQLINFVHLNKIVRFGSKS